MQNLNRQRYLDMFDRMTEDLLETYTELDKATFHRPLGEGKWTAGQVLEHLIKSEKGTLLIIDRTPAAPAGEGRVADEKVALIEGFKSPEQQLVAPPNLQPGDPTGHKRMDMLDVLADLRGDMRTVYDFHPNEATVIEMYAHPIFGTLTVCEWFFFTAMHGERHRMQVVRGLEMV